MTRKVKILIFFLFALLGHVQEDVNSSDSSSNVEEMQRIQLKDTYSTTETLPDSSSASTSEDSSANGNKDGKGKKFSREDFIRGRVELDPRIIQRSFFFGRNVFPSKFEGDADIYRGTQIAENTFSGSSLVYNCEFEYWSCVSIEDANKCIEQRQLELKKFKHFYSCAYLKSYPSDKECESKQLDLIAYSDPSVLCVSATNEY